MSGWICPEVALREGGSGPETGAISAIMAVNARSAESVVDRPSVIMGGNDVGAGNAGADLSVGMAVSGGNAKSAGVLHFASTVVNATNVSSVEGVPSVSMGVVDITAVNVEVDMPENLSVYLEIRQVARLSVKVKKERKRRTRIYTRTAL